jgi:hypothetical protein
MSAEPEIQYDEFKTLAVAGDIEAMRKMVADGMDLNDDLDDDTTLLEEVIGEICAAEGTPRYDVVREMLALGADPKRLSEKGSSPLFAALLTMDYEMLQILLEAGADPNAMVMDSEFESLYDWAEGDYQIEVWGEDPLPERPKPEVVAYPDDLNEFLDALAVKHTKLRPDHLKLLRKFGALRMAEIKLKSLPPEPKD